jgi:hypothetical protein
MKTLTTKQCQHVGAVMPPHIASYITLYSYHTKTSKSTVIRSAIHNWWMEQNKNISAKSLVMSMKSKIQDEWWALKMQTPDAMISEFKEYHLKELLKKGVSPENVAQIIDIEE